MASGRNIIPTLRTPTTRARLATCERGTIGSMSAVASKLARLAVVFLGLGVLSLLGGLAIVVIGLTGSAAMFASRHVADASVVASIAVTVGIVVALGGVPEILTWYGLMGRKPWGRFLGIAMCTTLLPLFPLGTLFGGYGLSVLLTDDAARAFGQQRSWLTDGIALAFGWMAREGRGARGRGQPRSNHDRRGGAGGAAGCGCFTFVAIGVLIGLALGGNLGGVVQGLRDGNWSSSSPPPVQGGAPDSRWGDEGRDPRGAVDPPVDVRVSSDPRVDVRVRSGGAPPNDAAIKPQGAPVTTAPKSGKGSIWIYTDAAGTPHMVDDIEKIPTRFRAQARNP